MNSENTTISPSKSIESCYVSRYGRSITPKKILDPSVDPYDNSEHAKSRNSSNNLRLSGQKKDISPVKKDNNLNRCVENVNLSPSKRIRNENFTSLPKTPYSLRQRLKTKIQYEMEKDEEEPFDVSEESEWEDCVSESSESSDENDVETPSSPILKSTLYESFRSNTKTNYVYDPSEYLEKSSAKSLTSSKKLARLEDIEVLNSELSSFVPSHSNYMSSLFKHNQSFFYRWLYALSKGYNILVYGLGSKKLLLDQFQCVVLNSCRVFVINGYFPGITMKEIVSSLCELLGAKTKETVDVAFSLLENLKTPLFLLIHNIDGLALRQDKVQSFFSQLASQEKVHVVASIDHINAPLLWDQKKLSCFNFIWEDCTTYHPYSKEKNIESSLMVRSSASMALSSLRNVFRSLNKNSRNIFKLLLEHSLNPENKNFGLQFSELYRLCRRQFIVSSDLALRTQLTEFIDHQLVKWKKETDILTVTVDQNVLKTFRLEIDSEGL